jgi:hypothetical protein
MSISKSLNNSAYNHGRSILTTSAELLGQEDSAGIGLIDLQGDADIAFGHVASHVTTLFMSTSIN